MGKVRTSFVVLLTGLVGFVLGAAIAGYAAMWIGVLFLSRVPGGIHSDWTLVVLFGIVAGIGLGGTAGTKAALRLARSWRREKE
jgi:hypothetical protein